VNLSSVPTGIRFLGRTNEMTCAELLAHKRQRREAVKAWGCKRFWGAVNGRSSRARIEFYRGFR
jgi:hypothetical protein